MKTKLQAIIFLLIFFSTNVFGEVLQEVIVKEGDTLWSVASFYLKDQKRWPEILRYNNLPSSDPNVILPGMKLRVPIVLIKEHLRAAHLVYLLNSVKYRRQKDADWQDAELNMELYNDDGLRTMRQSIAQVKFPSGELLKLDENSLIILRPEKSREEIDLLSGGVRSSRTKVLSSDTVIDPKIEVRGHTPDFKTKLREDKTTLVEVYDGMVDVTAQGRTITVTKGFGTAVKFKEPPSLPQILPPLPDFNTAGADQNDTAKPAETITSNNLELNVSGPQNGHKQLQAKTLKKISKYHIQISSSSTFSSTLVDRIETFQEKINLSFKDFQIEDGVYYYRIAFVDEMDFEGQFSQPMQLRLDTSPPQLDISTDMELSEDKQFIHLEGKTEPGVILKMADKLIPVDSNGKFFTALLPKKGEYKTSILAIDLAGNKTEKEISLNPELVSKLNRDISKVKKPARKKVSVIYYSIALLTLVVIAGVTVFITI